MRHLGQTRLPQRVSQIILGVLCLYLLASLLAYFSYSLGVFQPEILRFDLEKGLLPPSSENWFGTDSFGRDVFLLQFLSFGKSMITSALICGVALSSAFALACLTFFPTRRFRAFYREIETWISLFPDLLIIAILQFWIDSPQILLAIALITGAIPDYARLLRGEFFRIAESEYYRAALSLGAKPFHLFKVHLWRGTQSWLRAKLPLIFSQMIVAESTLNSLVFATSSASHGSDLSWGSLMNQARDHLLEHPLLALFFLVPTPLFLLTTLTALSVKRRRVPNVSSPSEFLLK